MRDVRMRGFAERADVEEVERFLDEVCAPLEAEPVDLLASAGRVLAEDVVASVAVPGFARAAMDGYAVRGEDTFGASAYDPVPFRLDLVRMGLVWLGITGITVVVGLAGSRSVLRRPPLAVFRDLAG